MKLRDFFLKPNPLHLVPRDPEEDEGCPACGHVFPPQGTIYRTMRRGRLARVCGACFLKKGAVP